MTRTGYISKKQFAILGRAKEMEYIKTLPHIYDIATSDENWTTALDHLGNAANANGAAIYASSNTELDFEVSATNSYYLTRAKEVAEYLKKFRHYDEESIPYVLSNAPFQLVTDEEIWPTLDVVHGREDIHFLREKLGVNRRAGIKLSHDQSWHAVLSFQFGLRNNDPISPIKTDIQILSRHLSKAIEINRFYVQLRQRYRAVLSVLNKVDVGICIALGTGEVISRNQKLTDLLSQEDGIKLDRQKCIQLHSTQETKKLNHYISECASTAAGKNNRIENTLVIERKSEREPMLVEVSPLRDGSNEMEGCFCGAMLLIIEPDNPPQLSVSSLKKLYKLTKTECDIASSLLEGKTISTIAEMRDVALDTVKNQCRSIYSKLDVNSRAQLIKRIVTISPPIL